MRILRSALLAASLFFSSCYSPQKVNYAPHLESSYKDPLPSLLNDKKERLEDMDFGEYLIDTEDYLTRLNRGEEELDMDEFYARLLPYHEYLEVMANETFSIDRISISDDPKIFRSSETIGVARTYVRTIFLREKYLDLGTYAHEFGHLTDNKEDFICGLPRLTGIDLCPDFDTHHMRVEMVADAFELYIAYTLADKHWFIAAKLSWDAVPLFKDYDYSESVKDLLETLSRADSHSFYTVEGKIIAVLQKYKFGNAKATWEYIRNHDRKHMLKTLDEITKKHGPLGALIDSSLDEIEDYFWR